MAATGCTKAVFPPLPALTRIEIVSGRYPDRGALKRIESASEISEVVRFVDGHRSGWTRSVFDNFGAAVVRAHFYDGSTYLGYFGVGKGFFETQRGGIVARKRVSMVEANRFVAVIGVRGWTLNE